VPPATGPPPARRVRLGRSLSFGSAPPASALGRGDVHVWYLSPDAVPAPLLLDGCLRLLSDDEQARWGRFHFAEGRRRYLVAHALLRTVLSRYAGVEPRAWRFTANAYGRPRIALPRHLWRLRFNLSHTDGLVACAVTVGRPVGVDVEHTGRPGRLAEVAERFFAPGERASLLALPERAWRDRFFEYWTLKESYIKARGRGLSIPLDEFGFDVRDGRPAGISFGPGLRDRSARWQFALLRPTPHHVLALSVPHGTDGELTVRAQAADPLSLAGRPIPC
jgi:4'-phosphopantetheinyl transferase